MKFVRTIPITDVSGRKRSLQICVGDITDTAQSGPVGMLAISCFPDDYLPRPNTIVGQLKKMGIDVATLAQNKAVDERHRWHTWISKPLLDKAPFGRIACFEHGIVLKPHQVVGNLFRALTGFVLEDGRGELDCVRVPLLATGDQQSDKYEMLEAIIRQAYNQLRMSLPVETVQIVLYSGWGDLHELIFNSAVISKQVQDEWALTRLSQIPSYDFFISYRRIDHELVNRVLTGLRVRRPELRVFLDHQELALGVFWKPELVGSIYNSQKFLCFISDSYVDSGECMDEFHAALSCGRHRGNFLRPLLSLTGRSVDELPTAIKNVNLIDARCPPRRFEEVLEAVLSP
jgi:hypothetical protein